MRATGEMNIYNVRSKQFVNKPPNTALSYGWDGKDFVDMDYNPMTKQYKINTNIFFNNRGLGVALYSALSKDERKYIKQSGDVDTQALKSSIALDEFTEVVPMPTALVAHMIYALNNLADISIAWERIFERTNMNTNVHTVLQEGIFFAQMSEEEYHTKVVNSKDKLPSQADQRNQASSSNNRGGFGNNKAGKGNYKGFNYDPNFYKKKGNESGNQWDNKYEKPLRKTSMAGEGKYQIPARRSMKSQSTMTDDSSSYTLNTSSRSLEHPYLPESNSPMFTHRQIEKSFHMQDNKEEEYLGTPEDKPILGESGDTKHTPRSLEQLTPVSDPLQGNSEVHTPPHLAHTNVENDSICLKNDTNLIKNNKYMSPTRPYHLEFNSEPPRINVANYCKLRTPKQEDLIKELIHKKILIPCDSTKLRCIANSFFVGEGKKTRLITDFKCLNPFLKLKLPIHRMDARSIAVRLSKHGFRSNLDLSRAFYSIPIAKTEYTWAQSAHGDGSLAGGTSRKNPRDFTRDPHHL
eukprot:GHVR01004399.1.p1 GENE.GHVR01004399.1~~GHVR01004399.1.p1  ORF type:complete len:521 (-),score=60.06 GHVR01004399.1:569-2131(-)